MNEKAIKLYARKNFMAYLIIYLVSLLFDAQTLLQSNFMVSMQICTYMKYNNNPPILFEVDVMLIGLQIQIMKEMLTQTYNHQD